MVIYEAVICKMLAEKNSSRKCGCDCLEVMELDCEDKNMTIINEFYEKLSVKYFCNDAMLIQIVLIRAVLKNIMYLGKTMCYCNFY